MGGKGVGRLSEGEWRVMRALWSAGGEAGRATARQVVDALEPGTAWAYTTVKTMLDRLAEKNVVTRKEQRGALVYKPRITREDAQRREVEALLSGVFGGRGSKLVHFLIEEERLSPKDRLALQRLLERAGLEPDPEED